MVMLAVLIVWFMMLLEINLIVWQPHLARRKARRAELREIQEELFFW